MATSPALTIFRGEDVTIPWDIDEDITGWTLALDVNATMQDVTPTLTVAGTITDAAAGYCEVALTDTHTETLAPGLYYYELSRTNSGAEAVLAQGRLTVRPRVAVA